MNSIYFLFFTLSIGCAFGKIEDDWNNFKEYYNKNYSSKAEEQHHFNNFKNNMKEINAHNKLYDDNVVFYKKGITKFADLNSTEFVTINKLDARPMNNGRATTNPNNNRKASNSSEYVDWREKGAVTRVKDQGTCGSYWIFSAVGTLEGLHFRKNKKLVTLSEQNIIDCINNNTCTGGWPPLVFLYLLNAHGINKEEDYPYEGVPGKCRYDELKDMKPFFQDIDIVIGNDEDLKDAVRNFGPMVLSVYAGEKWQHYRSGVWYEQECSDKINHAALLVGFGRENGHDYWLIKNSWSKNWGESGYMKIARGKHDNYCGISYAAYYIY